MKLSSDQIQNLISTITNLFGDIASLLHNQLHGPPVGPAPMFKDRPNLGTTESTSQPKTAQPTSQLTTKISLPTDCQDVAARGLYSFHAYCDMDTDGGVGQYSKNTFIDLFISTDAGMHTSEESETIPPVNIGLGYTE